MTSSNGLVSTPATSRSVLLLQDLAALRARLTSTLISVGNGTSPFDAPVGLFEPQITMSDLLEDGADMYSQVTYVGQPPLGLLAPHLEDGFYFVFPGERRFPYLGRATKYSEQPASLPAWVLRLLTLCREVNEELQGTMEFQPSVWTCMLEGDPLRPAVVIGPFDDDPEHDLDCNVFANGMIRAGVKDDPKTKFFFAITYENVVT